MHLCKIFKQYFLKNILFDHHQVPPYVNFTIHGNLNVDVFLPEFLYFYWKVTFSKAKLSNLYFNSET